MQASITKSFSIILANKKRLTEIICQPLPLLVARTGVEPVTSGL